MGYEPKPLKFAKNSLEKISEKTIEIHYEKLYKGYVAKYNEVWEKLDKADLNASNQSYSDYRALHQGQSFNLDAIILHELYFGNLGGKNSCEGLEIEKAIINQFGSINRFKELLTAAGMAARGWAVAAVGFHDNNIHIFTCDYHNEGGIWGAKPILVLDVYEHAYFIDFGSDRKSYIEAFWKNLDWSVVEKRFAGK